MSDPMRARPRKPSWLRVLARALRSSAERNDLIWELRRRRRGEPPLPDGPIRNVIVICHGNICRSPFGEHHLASLCPQLEVRSAGLEAGEYNPAQPGALRIAPEFNLDLTQHASHRLNAEDVAWADLIVGMTGRHQAAVLHRFPTGRAKMRLLGDYLPDTPHAIEDPWGYHDDFFRSVFERIALADQRIAQLVNLKMDQPGSHDPSNREP